jgi:parallel beta-helix repeat protein
MSFFVLLLGAHVIASLFLDFSRFDTVNAIVSVTDPVYGAIANDGKDDTRAFQAALAKSLHVHVPPGEYEIDGTLRLRDNGQLSGYGKSVLVMGSTRTALLFDLSDVRGARLSNFTINGNKGNTPTSYAIYLNNATDNEISDNVFIDLPGDNKGSIQVTGTSSGNIITRNTSTGAEGSFAGFIGSGVRGNEFSHNRVTDSGGFGIFVAGGAHDNLLAYNETRSNRLELIGITYQSHHNRVVGNHAEGTGDNGISITGHHNTVSGNICYKNHLAGIWVWGSFNTITGNISTSNNQVGKPHPWSGIGVSADFGGVGQYNTIIGNITDDDQVTPSQYNGVRIINNAYPPWNPRVPIESGTFSYFGLNVYRAAGDGTTGVTPPTHTSGSFSDGGIIWTHVNTFLGTAAPAGNIVVGNVYGRNASGIAAYDLSGWRRNRLDLESSTHNEKAD